MSTARKNPVIELVVCDLAGTTVDQGSTTPIRGFDKVFSKRGLRYTIAEITGPMGRKKDDHIREVFAIPHIAEQWKAKFGHLPDENDVQELHKEFVAVDSVIIPQTSTPIAGVPEALRTLKAKGVKIAFSTGYPRVLADLCLKNLRDANVPNDFDISADEVPAGRPAPHMLLQALVATHGKSVKNSLAIGDTEADIRAANNAGFIAVGVRKTGMLVGLNAEESAALPAAELQARVAAAEKKLFEFGADHVIDSTADLPALIADIESGAVPARRS